jgi:hypothetical protein
MVRVNAIARRLLAFVPDETFTRLQFRYRLGQRLDLDHPRTFNEKLQWLKLRYRDPLMRQCADKLAVRDYVAGAGGADLLIPLIGVYRRAQEIDFYKLPEQFVLKANHGSGWNIICRDRRSMDLTRARARLNRWLQTDFSRIAREWVYEGIEPRIICEEYLATANGEPPSDYKFFCFHGEPRFIQVDYDRFIGHRRALYTPAWEKLPCALEYTLKEEPTPPPQTLARMLRVAAQLSQPFPFARVDLYELDDRVYFGELTFFPGKGVERFRPREFDAIFGERLDLSRVCGLHVATLQ